MLMFRSITILMKFKPHLLYGIIMILDCTILYTNFRNIFISYPMVNIEIFKPNIMDTVIRERSWFIWLHIFSHILLCDKQWQEKIDIL